MQRTDRTNAVAPLIATEAELAAVAAALAGSGAVYSDGERRLIRGSKKADPSTVAAFRGLILAGDDPLGDCFVALRSSEDRRAQGAVYTPQALVEAMAGWAAGEAKPIRVVDPGVGSGRFLIAAARAFPKATLIGCDIDPLALLMVRANAAVHGFSNRLDARLCEYRHLDLPQIKGPTLFIGNPPYVRHHGISSEAKSWFSETAAELGFKASKLAGLHVHFFLRTRQIAKRGDYGAFLTSAEWLDVNYGSVLRILLGDGLGGASLHVFAADRMPFENALTTGAITCFRVGRRPDEFLLNELSSLGELKDLSSGKRVPWSSLKTENRWSQFLRDAKAPTPGMVLLGDLFRVHRGTVTGANRVFIAGTYPGPLPSRFLVSAITKGRDLVAAGAKLTVEKAKSLRKIVAIPASAGDLTLVEKTQVEAFKVWAKKQGADKTFTGRQRGAWWSVPLREPAPILCTYMARRAPSFVRNLAGVAHINIAHGLYPKVPMTAADLDAYALYLSRNVCVTEGRTYAGGLTKFEPKEIERILVPCLKRIHADAHADTVDARRPDPRRGAVESQLQS